MAEEKRISFSATDNGVVSFIKKMQSESKTLYSDIAKEAQKQTSDQKAQFRIIQDQLKFLREQVKLEKEITAEKLRRQKEITEKFRPWDAERSASRRKEQRIQQEMEGITEREKKLGYADDNFKRDKEDSKATKQNASIFGEVLRAGLFRDLTALMRQAAGAQTGLDLVSPFASLAGGMIGGSIGTGLNLANATIFGTGFGKTNADVIGAQLGKEVSGLAADLVVRHFRTLDQFQQQSLKYRALGGNESLTGLSGMGFDDIAAAAGMGSATGAMGTGRGASRAAQMMLSLSRLGWSDDGSTLAALGMQRSGGGSGVQNVQKVLGIAFAEGLDKAKFSDVIRSQTALLQQFAQTKTTVSADDANRVLFEFNRMGGMFGAGDPRSIMNIQAINQDLSNPGSPFGQALNYAVLRRLNPNADPFQLMKMQEQGLQTPGFLQGVMDDVTGMGGSETLQKFMLKNRFSSLSFDAIDTLFKNKDTIGSMSQPELSKMLGLDQMKTEAEKFTSGLMKDQAEVTNAFKTGFMDGITAVENQFEIQMKKAVDEVADHLREKFGLISKSRQVNVDPKTPAKSGATRIKEGGKSYDYYPPVTPLPGKFW